MRYVINYVHNNPVKHKVCRELHQYPYSSYNAYLSQESDLVATGEGLRYFEGSICRFLEEHEQHRKQLLEAHSGG